MELVEATAEDLDALAARWYDLASAMEAYDELNELVYEDAADVPVDPFRARLDDEIVTDYLVVLEGETVGYVTVEAGEHASRAYDSYLRIVDLYVDASHRGQGLGSRVLDRVEQLARDRGRDHLKVSCEWDNEGARRFYREAGFRPKQVDFARPLE